MPETRVPAWRRYAALALTGTAAAAVVFAAGPAYAHVTVDPAEAEQGGYATITFRVPNESDDAGTTKLQVDLPTDTPINSVRTQPKPGWSANLHTEELDEPVDVGGVDVEEAVTRITWSADDGVRIGPDEFEEFRISAGPLPADVEQLELPAAQTYDDGEVVRWDQPMGDDGTEPEHPAPVLALVEPAEDGDGHATGSAAADETADGQGANDADDGGAESDEASAAAAVDTTARTLGGIGTVVGVLGLAVGVGAVVRNRRSHSTPAVTQTEE